MSEIGKDYDVLIVGAGLSGIGMAHHLQKKCPSLSWRILEARERMGGTWDLFRYPGIRSDSDMYTLGFPFRPWKDRKAIADGPSILRYIKETAVETGVDKKILYNHKAVSGSWDSSSKTWTVCFENGNSLKCRFLIMCSGYYNYDHGHTPSWPGQDSFQGRVVHPQKWDEGLDCTGKKVVVIGSGATAVTLVPELAKKAKEVVMLQRSPTYVSSLPSVDGIAESLKRALPEMTAHHLVRWKNILISMAFFQFCRRFPAAARKLLAWGIKNSVKDPGENFTPRYAPWDQRLCFVPDGDLFRALNEGKARVVTDSIKSFTSGGLQLESGKEIEADIIVTATGLVLKFLGGISISVDGEVVDPRNLVPYKSSMFSGLPNLGMVFGYTNASWTLKCNMTSEWLAGILAYMERRGLEVVTPEEDPSVALTPLIDFSSGYFQRSAADLPRQGQQFPWKVNQNYFADIYAFKMRNFDDEGLQFS